jgi:hypothetical protein
VLRFTNSPEVQLEPHPRTAFGGVSGVGLLPRILVGIAYSIMMTPGAGAYLDQAITAGALGFPTWGLLLPFRPAGAMQWTAETMRANFPALVAWVVFGVVWSSPTGTHPDYRASPGSREDGDIQPCSNSEANSHSQRRNSLRLIPMHNAGLITPV